MKIAFIGFGEAAAAFGKSLAETEPGLRFACYDILFGTEGRDGELAMHATAAGVEAAGTPAAAIEAADWIVSAVTAASSLKAAQSAAEHIEPGQVFVDINSVSPGRKRETAALVEERGAAYVDMAVMAPVHPRGHRTPVLVAGRLTEGFAATIERLDFSFEIVGATVGGATAIKMVRSVFVKGLEAITVEALLAAEAAGCFESVLASLSGSFPGLNWPDFAPYEFERSLTHGVRRAAEMRESGATLDEFGLDGDLARAVAAIHDRMGALKSKNLPTDDLPASIGAILKHRREGDR